MGAASLTMNGKVMVAWPVIFGLEFFSLIVASEKPAVCSSVAIKDAATGMRSCPAEKELCTASRLVRFVGLGNPSRTVHPGPRIDGACSVLVVVFARVVSRMDNSSIRRSRPGGRLISPDMIFRIAVMMAV